MFVRREKLSSSKKLKLALSPSKKGFKRSLHYLLWRIKRLPGTPEYIARGFAIGVAVNFWPVLFTHLVIGYVTARLLKGDVLAMFIGTMLGNPWTFAMVYPVMYKIGKVLLGMNPHHHADKVGSLETIWEMIANVHSWQGFVTLVQEVFLPLGLGGFLLGLPCTMASYYLVRNMVRVYRAQRRKHLLAQFDRTEHEIEDPA